MNAPWRIPKLLFGFRERVSRPSYLTCGIALMCLKFLLEWAAFRASGTTFGLVDFLTPFAQRRHGLYFDRAAYLGDLMLNLPFLWLGFSLSARRAMDARLRPLVGLLFLIPGAHYVLMAFLSIVPSLAVHGETPARDGDYRHPPIPGTPAFREIVPPPPEVMHRRQAVIFAALTGAAVGFGLCWSGVPEAPSVVIGGIAASAAGVLSWVSSRRSARDQEATLVGSAAHATRMAPAASGSSLILGILGILVLVAVPILLAFVLALAVPESGLGYIVLPLVYGAIYLLACGVPVAFGALVVSTAFGAYRGGLRARAEITRPSEDRGNRRDKQERERNDQVVVDRSLSGRELLGPTASAIPPEVEAIRVESAAPMAHETCPPPSRDGQRETEAEMEVDQEHVVAKARRVRTSQT